MKTESNVFWVLVAFFAIVTPIYWFTSTEIIGTVALGFTTMMAAMIALFFSAQARNFDNRPEDNKDGEIHEAAGPYGFFPPKSIWPFWCTIVVVIIFLGPALEQAWISLIGFGVGIWALLGWMLEYYRGDYQH